MFEEEDDVEIEMLVEEEGQQIGVEKREEDVFIN